MSGGFFVDFFRWTPELNSGWNVSTGIFNKIFRLEQLSKISSGILEKKYLFVFLKEFLKDFLKNPHEFMKKF